MSYKLEFIGKLRNKKKALERIENVTQFPKVKHLFCHSVYKGQA